MRATRWVVSVSVLALGVLSTPEPTLAQQITGTPGSPEATTTITGKQLPPPDPKFGGVIKEKASESTPWWPPRVVPPKGAPNVLLIMTDDQGFGAPSTFGGVIPTPTHGPHPHQCRTGRVSLRGPVQVHRQDRQTNLQIATGAGSQSSITNRRSDEEGTAFRRYGRTKRTWHSGSAMSAFGVKRHRA